jgi:isocitrate/isopropylmalate dehydrogenase
MLETLGLEADARAVEAGVEQAVRTGHVTPDVGGTLGTKETGDYIAGQVRANA